MKPGNVLSKPIIGLTSVLILGGLVILMKSDLVSFVFHRRVRVQVSAATVQPPDRTRPFAVMIDNHPGALPQSGLDKADAIFEAPVEGSLTRLMAIFRSASSSEIGPVRSARPYFEDWAAGLDAVYAHVGGSDEALANLRTGTKGLDDADQMSNDAAFWRDDKRIAPHNTYTSSDLMRALIGKKNWRPETEALPVARGATSATGTAVASFDILHDAGGETSQWHWDASASVWRRSFRGKDTTSADGKPVGPATVVVIEAQKAAMADPHLKGLIGVKTNGSGKATVLRDGVAIPAKWSKASVKDPLVIADASGNPIPFAEGQVWYDIILANFGGAFTPSA